jgi:arginyl-tRNA synthetase
MVELPEGKMKSREGTVVDADDLIAGMYNTAKETSLELGKIDNLSEEEQDSLFKMISLGALKYFILKVDPRKTMLFDPKESIDFNGNTGPFIQYTHARIKSILRKAVEKEIEYSSSVITPESELSAKEIRIIKTLNTFPAKIAEAGEAHSPALVANYAYELAKEFNQYYHDTPILREENENLLKYRLVLIETIAKVLSKAMAVLGINLPERM